MPTKGQVIKAIKVLEAYLKDRNARTPPFGFSQYNDEILRRLIDLRRKIELEDTP